MSTIYKYDYITGEVLATYETIKEASIDNNMTYVAVMKMLQQNMLKYPRRDYYLGYSPKPRWVIRVYNNETRLLLATYKNEKDASVGAGVNQQHIGWVVRRDIPFDKRYLGSTSLWFRRETIND